MNIRLETKVDQSKQRWANYVQAILKYEFGILSVLLFLILFGVESYWRSLYPGDHALRLGGIGSLIGLGLLICGVYRASAPWLRYRKIWMRVPDRHIRLTLTDDYMEQEVPGLWQWQYRWCTFSGVTESSSAFVLKSRGNDIEIPKSELKDPKVAGELRAFLTARFPVKATAFVKSDKSIGG